MSRRTVKDGVRRDGDGPLGPKRPNGVARRPELKTLELELSRVTWLLQASINLTRWLGEESRPGGRKEQADFPISSAGKMPKPLVHSQCLVQ